MQGGTVQQARSRAPRNPCFTAGNRLTQIADSQNGTITYTYDGLDRITGVTTPSGSVSYTYYANGLRQTMSASGAPTVTYTYDAGNRLIQLTQAAGTVNNNTAQTVSFAYDSGNRRTQTTLANGVAMQYSYDAANRLTGITYVQGGNTLGNLTYAYDAAGRRTQIGGSLATANPTPASSSTTDAANRLTSFNGQTLTYDANGNLTSDGSNTYTWNARDQLIAISGATTASFSYDALGRRSSKTINGVNTGYLYDGANFIEELSGGAVQSVVVSAGIDAPLFREKSNTIQSYLSDALGSTIALLDASGNNVVSYAYSLYGITTNTNPGSTNAQQFTGRENDGDGLYYYRARYYSPTLGRFISQDPIGLLGGMDPYAYVGGNPVSYTDPSGKCPWCLLYVVAVEWGEIAAELATLGVYMWAGIPNPESSAISGAASATKAVSGGLCPAAERATQIADSLGKSKGFITIGVTDTAEGVRIISSSENALRPRALAALVDGELAVTGAGHAEVTGFNAAKSLGLTPIGTAASRPICPECAEFLEQQSVQALSPLKQ